MMAANSNRCYCANYYGSINCQNMVPKFGERCKLCLALKSGASLPDKSLPNDVLWGFDNYDQQLSSSLPYRPRGSTDQHHQDHYHSQHQHHQRHSEAGGHDGGSKSSGHTTERSPRPPGTTSVSSNKRRT